MSTPILTFIDTPVISDLAQKSSHRPCLKSTRFLSVLLAEHRLEVSRRRNAEAPDVSLSPRNNKRLRKKKKLWKRGTEVAEVRKVSKMTHLCNVSVVNAGVGGGGGVGVCHVIVMNSHDIVQAFHYLKLIRFKNLFHNTVSQSNEVIRWWLQTMCYNVEMTTQHFFFLRLGAYRLRDDTCVDLTSVLFKSVVSFSGHEFSKILKFWAFLSRIWFIKPRLLKSHYGFISFRSLDAPKRHLVKSGNVGKEF